MASFYDLEEDSSDVWSYFIDQSALLDATSSSSILDGNTVGANLELSSAEVGATVESNRSLLGTLYGNTNAVNSCIPPITNEAGICTPALYWSSTTQQVEAAIFRQERGVEDSQSKKRKLELEIDALELDILERKKQHLIDVRNNATGASEGRIGSNQLINTLLGHDFEFQLPHQMQPPINGTLPGEMPVLLQNFDELDQWRPMLSQGDINFDTTQVAGHSIQAMESYIRQYTSDELEPRYSNIDGFFLTTNIHDSAMGLQLDTSTSPEHPATLARASVSEKVSRQIVIHNKTNASTARTDQAIRKQHAQTMAQLQRKIPGRGTTVSSMVSVFACREGVMLGPKRKTAAQRAKSQAVRAAGGACLLCSLLKKTCSGKRPCETCQWYFARGAKGRSTSFEWTCDVRTKLSDLNVFCDRKVSLSECRLSLEQGIKILESLPAAVLDNLELWLFSDGLMHTVWTEIYTDGLVREIPGSDTSQTGKIRHLLSAVTLDRLVLILFLLAHFLKDISPILPASCDSLRAILEQLCQCSATLLLHKADHVPRNNTPPFEAITLIAVAGAQGREVYSQSRRRAGTESLQSSEATQIEHFDRALKTYIRYLAPKAGNKSNILGRSRSGYEISLSTLLDDVEDMYHFPFERGAPYQFRFLMQRKELVATQNCIEDQAEIVQEDPSQRVGRPLCYCNLVSATIPEGKLWLFGHTQASMREQLHEAMPELERADGSRMAFSVDWSSFMILNDVNAVVYNRTIGDMFAMWLDSWLRAFWSWLSGLVASCPEVVPLSEGLKKSVLIISVIYMLERLAMYSRWLSDNPEGDRSPDAFLARSENEPEWRCLVDGFWDDMFDLFCLITRDDTLLEDDHFSGEEPLSEDGSLLETHAHPRDDLPSKGDSLSQNDMLADAHTISQDNTLPEESPDIAEHEL